MNAQSRSGPLHDLVRHGYVGPVWCEGREILRRIFVTVRDRQWREVRPTRFDYAIDETTGIARFNAHHVSEDVDFEWRGVLQVSENLRELKFSFDGKALRDMEVCRLGLVVLHPVESMIDSQLSVVSSELFQRLTVPRLLSPQPIIDGVPQAITQSFSSLVIERPDFGRLELRFAGDLFELEDQRNWGDASFKTYCTPLRLGFPRKVKAGTSVSHSVAARFEPGAVPAIERSARSTFARRAVFPALGCESVFIELSGSPDMASLRKALESASSKKVELLVELGTEPEFPADLLNLLARFRRCVQRVLICGPGSSLPSPQGLELLREKLESEGSMNVPLVAATRGYFVEFNRSLKFEAPISGIGFPLTATVHSDDPDTITENVAALVDIAETARHLTGVSDIVISPLALYHPRAANQAGFPKVLIKPWVTATLVNAALAGVTSVTLADDVVEALDSSSDGYLSTLRDCGGLEVAPLGEPLPTGVHGLKFLSKGSEPARMLIANLGSGVASLMLDEREVQIPRYGATWIEHPR